MSGAGARVPGRLGAWWWGVPVLPPAPWLAVLAETFERPRDAVAAVAVLERSCFASAHLGAIATTRPGAIHLAGSAHDFWRRPGLVLHEYRHVLDQWGRGLTRLAYLREALRHGYARNAFERDAIDFAHRGEPQARLRLQALGFAGDPAADA